jgi:hypothetical protein
MNEINKGDRLYIPVQVGAGAFSGECFVTLDAIEGPISGFISSAQVNRRNEDAFIEAKVLDLDSDRIAVRLRGSFFTTTGLAHISRQSRFELAA